ncbi:MAG: sulfatase-like hydrolase/transferase [Bacteroidota bacterium]
MLPLLLLLALAGGPQAVPDSPFQPHVVWFIADDLSPIMAAYGDSTVHTPHLDRLAQEGVTVERAYVTTPVCAPSRTAMLTGVYPTSMGALHMRTQRRTSALDQVTEPELLAIPTYEAVPPPDVLPVTIYLQRAGYFTANLGKEDYQFATPAGLWHARTDTAHWRQRPDPTQTFFYIHNDVETHESQIWGRAGQPLAVHPAAVRVPAYYPDTSIVRRDIAQQYTNLLATDANVGRVLAELEADGLLESTVFIFVGDHGDGLPRAKRDLYDSGLRVPLIVRIGAEVRAALGDRLGAPPPGGRITHPVSGVDLAPTLLALAGLPVPAAMQGLPFLGDPQAPERRYAVGVKGRMDPSVNETRAVTDGRWKYIRNLQPERPYVQTLPYRDRVATMQLLRQLHAKGALTGPPALWFRATKPAEELYDTHADPDEVRNLATDPRLNATLARLRGALDAWADATGDLGVLPEPQLIRRLWPPDGTQPTTAAPVPDLSAHGNTYTVTLTSATPGALLAYAIDGQAWRPYTGPFEATAETTLTLRAHRLGHLPADTVLQLPQP